MNRNQITKKIRINCEKIKILRDKNIELDRLQLMLTDKKRQYTEQEETTGRGKTKETNLIGRVHWKEYFLDEDTGHKIEIKRSCAVRKNGEWLPGY